MTQKDILSDWPEDFAKPNQTTLSRALRRGVEQGLVLRQGTGQKNDPYKYWLPGREEDLQPGEGASREELVRWNVKVLRKHFAARGMPYPDSTERNPSEDDPKSAERTTPEPTTAHGDPKATNATEPTDRTKPSHGEENSASEITPEESQPAAAVLEATDPAAAPSTGPARQTRPRAKAAPPQPSPIATSPTEIEVAETAPLPPGLVRPMPDPDQEQLARERLKSRRWPV
jgi:hypothetical protein